MDSIRPSRRVYILSLLFVAGGLVFFGCSGPKQSINAAAIDALVFSVTERHDLYVGKDTSLSASERDQYLRSSALLKAIQDQAMGRTPLPPPTVPRTPLVRPQ